MNRKSVEDLQFARIKEAASGFTQTLPGKAAVLSLPSLGSADECLKELVLVDEAASILGMDDAPTLDGVEDIAELVEKARRSGVLTGKELVACARLMRAGHEVRHSTQSLRLRAPGLAEVFEELPDLGAIAERILSTFDEEFRIRDDASPRLGELRAEATSLGRRVKVHIEKMLADKEISGLLQDDYYTLREGRYVLPVRSEERRFVPGIIHGTSQTGQTVYMEPEDIVHDNNQLKVVLDEIEVEEYAIRTDRSGLVGRYAERCEQTSDLLWRLDTILARARLAGEMGACIPASMGRDKRLFLKDARNPVLVLLGRRPVPVTIDLREAGDAGCALVVSGPNAGGKSVTLSTVGLCVVMTHYGMLPPVAEGSIVPWYDQLFTILGDPTSMDRSVSTFTGQLENVREVLDRGEGRALALVDELATGTEPRQGEALALAIVQAMVEGGAECIVATHYGMLKRAGVDDDRFINARVGMDADTGRPNFSLEMGLPGESNPLDAAASVGLPASIVEKARSLIGEKERKLGEAIREAENLKADLAREKTDAEDLKRRLEADKASYEKELKRLRKDSDRLVYQARKDVLDKMKRLEDELERIGKQAREEEMARKKVAVKRREVARKKVQVREEMEKEAPLVEDLPTTPFPPEELRTGASVYVRKLRAVGEVVDISRDMKRIDVQVGLIKTRVKPKDLYVPDSKKAVKKAAGKGARTAPSVSLPSPDLVPVEKQAPPGDRFVRTPENTIDIRGERVNDAIDMVDKWMDEAYLRELPEVMIIHGMGTSALRKAVRSYLNESRYCRSFRGGDTGEGGEGVTLALLK